MTHFSPAHLIVAPAGLVGRVLCWMAMRRNLAVISQMDDHMLADIGWHRVPQAQRQALAMKARRGPSRPTASIACTTMSSSDLPASSAC